MIFQMHFQNATDPTDPKTEFVAQGGDFETSEQANAWTRDVAARHPLPEGKQWLVCDETAPMFMRAAKPDAT